MRDDDVLTDAERHVRAVLRPADDRVRQVITRALSAHERRRWRPFTLAAAGAAALVLALLVFWQAGAPAQPALHISGSGSVVVVTSDDGRRWVINAEGEAVARGGYVIAFPQ